MMLNLTHIDFENLINLPRSGLVLYALPLFDGRLHEVLRVGVHVPRPAPAEGLAVHALVRASRLVGHPVLTVDRAVVAATHRLHLACGNRPHSYPRHL